MSDCVWQIRGGKVAAGLHNKAPDPPDAYRAQRSGAAAQSSPGDDSTAEDLLSAHFVFALKVFARRRGGKNKKGTPAFQVSIFFKEKEGGVFFVAC